MTLEILTADCLGPIRHGFFTRRGGASSGVFAGLNCGRGSSDQAEMVAINRARVAEAMGVRENALCAVWQAHTTTVLHIDEARGAPGSVVADAMVTNRPGLALSVLTADCQPVLLFDPQAQVIGAAHAGWRGALDGVLEATVEAMTALGARPASIRAAIGPAISQANYEVGPEFLGQFLSDDPHNERFFAGGAGERLHFDLPGFGLARLARAGVGTAEWIGQCTYADAARFYSYRRSCHAKQADYGRLISAIVLPRAQGIRAARA